MSSTVGGNPIIRTNEGSSSGKSKTFWSVVDATGEGGLLAEYQNGKTVPKKVAEDIWGEAILKGLSQIYQFFWTNGTLVEAKKVHRELSILCPESEVRLLEKTESGEEMQRSVNQKLRNALNDAANEGVVDSYSSRDFRVLMLHRKLWDEVMITLKQIAKNTNNTELVNRIDSLKKQLEDYQRKVSENYARTATQTTFLVKVKRGGMDPGINSEAEDNILEENACHHHLFVELSKRDVKKH